MTKANPGNCPQQSESVNRQGRGRKRGRNYLAWQSTAIWGCGATTKKQGLPEPPQRVHAQSRRNLLAGSTAWRGDAPLRRASCRAGTAAMREPQPLRLCTAFLPPRRGWESRAHCSWVFRRCFTHSPHFHNAPWPPSSQTDLMNTVLCVLGFIIPHIPPSQFCTR